ACFVGHKAHQRSCPVVQSAERFDVRAAAVARAGDDVLPAVGINVANPDEYAAAEVGVIRDKLIQRPRFSWQGRTVEYTDDRAAPIASADDYVVGPVAGNVPHRDVHTAADEIRERNQARHLVTGGVVDFDRHRGVGGSEGTRGERDIGWDSAIFQTGN